MTLLPTVPIDLGPGDSDTCKSCTMVNIPAYSSTCQLCQDGSRFIIISFHLFIYFILFYFVLFYFVFDCP